VIIPPGTGSPPKARVDIAAMRIASKVAGEGSSASETPTNLRGVSWQGIRVLREIENQMSDKITQNNRSNLEMMASFFSP
jgi:hypothetical protein